MIIETKNIRFEGNNYSEDWKREAQRRGLPNEPSTPGALKALVKEDTMAVFEKYKVFAREELRARYHIWLEGYNKVLEIEAQTLNEMVNSSIVPNAFDYQGALSRNLSRLCELKEKQGMKCSDESLNDLKDHLADVTEKIYYVRKNSRSMMKFLEETGGADLETKAKRYFEELKPLMEHIRRHADMLETVISDEHWDLPKYREMLFVK